MREKTQVEVVEVDYAGAHAALPAPGVVEAIAAARRCHRLSVQSHHLDRPHPRRARASRARWRRRTRSSSRSAPSSEGRPSPAPPGASWPPAGSRCRRSASPPPTRRGSTSCSWTTSDRRARAAHRSRRDTHHRHRHHHARPRGGDRPGPPGARGARVSTVVAVPVKDLVNAKQRLIPLPLAVRARRSGARHARGRPRRAGPRAGRRRCWSSRGTPRSRRWRGVTGPATLGEESQPRPHGSRRPRPAGGARPRGAALPHHPGRRAVRHPGRAGRVSPMRPSRRRARSSCPRCPASAPMRRSSTPPDVDAAQVRRALLRQSPGRGARRGPPAARPRGSPASASTSTRPEDLALLLERGPSTRSAGLLASLDVPARLARRTPGGVSVPPRYEVIGVEGLPEIGAGDDLAPPHRSTPPPRQGTPLAAGDLLVVSQKIVSKAEGRIVRLAEVTPSPETSRDGRGARPRPAARSRSSSRESRRVVRQRQGRAHRRDPPRAGSAPMRASISPTSTPTPPASCPRTPTAPRARCGTGCGALTGHRPRHHHRRHVRPAVARGADQRRDRRGRARAAQELSRREGSGRPRAAGDHPRPGRRAGLGGRARHGQARPHPRRHHPRARLAAAARAAAARSSATRRATSSASRKDLMHIGDPRRHGQGRRGTGAALGPGGPRDHHRLARRRARPRQGRRAARGRAGAAPSPACPIATRRPPPTSSCSRCPPTGLAATLARRSRTPAAARS